MATTSKGQEFLESFKDRNHQQTYELIKKNKDKTATEIAKTLLQENDIKLSWQNADTETKES